jgi:hypothetical protein
MVAPPPARSVTSSGVFVRAPQSIRWLFVDAMLLGLLVGARAETIQKWMTPDGKLYFGDRPPAGSTKMGEEGSHEPPANGSSQEGTPRSAEQERFSIDVSRERTKIEKALNNNAERLEEVDKQIAEVQRSPNVVPPWMERRAGFKNEKAETVLRLESQKRTMLAATADLWKRFDKLDAQVKKAYDGKAPDWWRSTLSCPKCPSRSEAESSLR